MIAGYSNTPTEWQADHDRDVRAFLDRCREKNLKLNKNKGSLKQHEVSFIGHILTPQGLKRESHKVKAIFDMPDPTAAQSQLRFLGMMNYLAKFLPRLSEETEVLRRLTETYAQWCWFPTHAQAMAPVIKMIISAPALAYYDVTKSIVIQCEASKRGLGAALLQGGRPLAFSYSEMSQTEQNYALI